MKTCYYFFALLLLLALTTPAMSSTDYWAWSFLLEGGVQTGATWGHFGASSDAVDSFDSLDRSYLQPGPQAYFGVLHRTGEDGWTGSSGFYRYDMRSPLKPGETKTWPFYVWFDPLMDPAAENLILSWLIVFQDAEPPPGTIVTVRLKSKPIGITGGPAEGTAWVLSSNPTGGVLLPGFRTLDGTQGYLFEMEAVMIPEPSSLIALTGCLLGAAGFVRRRR